MKKIQKLIAFAMALAMMVISFAACGKSYDSESQQVNGVGINAETTLDNAKNKMNQTPSYNYSNQSQSYEQAKKAAEKAAEQKKANEKKAYEKKKADEKKAAEKKAAEKKKAEQKKTQQKKTQQKSQQKKTQQKAQQKKQEPKKAENKSNTQTAMPNPNKKLPSLENLNETFGANFRHPGVMGVSDENFVSINGKIAEYNFIAGGYPCTWRYSKTMDDISGVYTKNGTAYAHAASDIKYVCVDGHKLYRWYDTNGGQYVLIIEDKGQMDDEQFCNIAQELEASTK